MAGCGELDKKLRNMFNSCDTSGDGTLDMLEVKKFLIKIKKCKPDDIPAKDVMLYFDQNDKDGDKKISYEEFSRVFKLKDNKDIPREQLKEHFKQYDTDGSGMIDSDEVFVHLCTHKGYSEEEAQQYIDKVDKNKDGHISLDEFCDDFYGKKE